MDAITYDSKYIKDLLGICRSTKNKRKVTNLLMLFGYLNEFPNKMKDNIDDFVAARKLAFSVDEIVESLRTENIVSEEVADKLIQRSDKFLNITMDLQDEMEKISEQKCFDPEYIKDLLKNYPQYKFDEGIHIKLFGYMNSFPELMETNPDLIAQVLSQAQNALDMISDLVLKETITFDKGIELSAPANQFLELTNTLSSFDIKPTIKPTIKPVEDKISLEDNVPLTKYLQESETARFQKKQHIKDEAVENIRKDLANSAAILRRYEALRSYSKDRNYFNRIKEDQPDFMTRIIPDMENILFFDSNCIDSLIEKYSVLETNKLRCEILLEIFSYLNRFSAIKTLGFSIVKYRILAHTAIKTIITMITDNLIQTESAGKLFYEINKFLETTSDLSSFEKDCTITFPTIIPVPSK